MVRSGNMGSIYSWYGYHGHGLAIGKAKSQHEAESKRLELPIAS